MTQNPAIFISYSRRDLKIVAPLVQFLRISAKDIFRDMESIPFGLEWRAVISDAIENCGMFLLFWCSHSAESPEVKKEYDQALTCQKPIVPVLLDQTKLIPKLQKYHGIDLSSLLGPHEERWVERQEETMGAQPGSRMTITTRNWELADPKDFLSGCVHLKQELSTIAGFNKDSSP